MDPISAAAVFLSPVMPMASAVVLTASSVAKHSEPRTVEEMETLFKNLALAFQKKFGQPETGGVTIIRYTNRYFMHEENQGSWPVK